MKNKVLNYESFIPNILQSVPELSGIYSEHIKDNDEILEHVLMGDITRFVRQNYKNVEMQKSIEKIFFYLNEGIVSSDENLQELISVSFLENLVGDDDCIKNINILMNKELREELAEYLE